MPPLLQAATEAGISESTLRRAKAVLRVRATKLGYGPAGAWQWQLPDEGTVLTLRCRTIDSPAIFRCSRSGRTARE
jgi:hypothetical protein